ncbi:hypothetical protein [Paenisporosarcina sp. NPDC076898]|uniref:hypothetical protein n=1 Tax=unclassified Paenisporosarcina TaxID=2642018 RepID=UPI003D01F8D8
MDLDILRNAIEGSNIEEAESILEEVGTNRNVNAVPLLIEYLKNTDNHRLRNAIETTGYTLGCLRNVILT